ncbi:MAG: hypothetical protein AAF500_04035 [Myxococcota bacterium]
MKYTGVLLAALVGLSSVAEAQDAAQSPPPGVISTTPAGYPPPSGPRSYEEHRREELKVGVKRTRTALIATSASLAVGLALTIPAFTGDRCVEDPFDENNFTCNTAGKALLGTGAPFLIVGFWGAIVSGIMLGVRKGKLRRLDEKIAYQSDAKFRWDPYRAKFVF